MMTSLFINTTIAVCMSAIYIILHASTHTVQSYTHAYTRVCNMHMHNNIIMYLLTCTHKYSTNVYQKHHTLHISLSTVVPLLRDHPYGPAKWSFKRGGPSKEVYASCTREMYASVTSIAQSDTQGGPSPVGLSKRGCTILSWQL